VRQQSDGYAVKADQASGVTGNGRRPVFLESRTWAEGARLRRRADFDRAGLGVTGATVKRHEATPWRMTVADY